MTTFATAPVLTHDSESTSPGVPVPDAAVPDAAALSDRICLLAAQIDCASAELICLLSEFDACDGWTGYGMKSCAHWLSWKCHIGAHAAREQVRVARALTGLPLLRSEFTAGRLSYAKVRALTRVAEPDSEADLVELAMAATAAQVERTVSGWRRAAPSLDEPAALAEVAAEQAAKRELGWHFDDDGMLVLRARVGPEEAAVLLAAIERAQDVLARDAPAQTAETQASPPVRSRPSAVDGLVALARAFVGGDAGRQPDAHLVVQLDAAVLQRELNAGLATYAFGGALTSEQARRLACDSRLSVVLFRGHGRRREVLDAGRRTRVVPAALRRALLVRDGGCVMPGCLENRPSRLDAHHVWHWADGGPTALDNLVMLCPTHHRAIHEEGYQVERRPFGFAFLTPDGDEIPAEPLAPRLAVGRRLPPVPPPATEPSEIPGWQGEPFQLDYILNTLLGRLDWRRRQRAALGEREALRAEAA